VLFLRLQERDICVAADESMYLGMHLDAMAVGAKSLHRTFRGERCCTSHERASIVLLALLKGLQRPWTGLTFLVAVCMAS
jgi:hypothetical protein